MSAKRELQYFGRFENGQIVLDSPLSLPEGARLEVQIKVKPTINEEERLQSLLALAGAIPDFECPPDDAGEAQKPQE